MSDTKPQIRRKTVVYEVPPREAPPAADAGQEGAAPAAAAQPVRRTPEETISAYSSLPGMNLVQVAVAHAKGKALLKNGNFEGALAAWQEAIEAKPPPHLRSAIDGCLAKLAEDVVGGQAGEGASVDRVLELAVRLIADPEKKRAAADTFAADAAKRVHGIRDSVEKADGRPAREDIAEVERAIVRLNVAAQLGSPLASQELATASEFCKQLEKNVVPEEALDHFQRGLVELGKSPPNLAGAVHHLKIGYTESGASEGKVAETYAYALTLWADTRISQVQRRYDYLQNPAEIEQAANKVVKILDDVRLAVQLGGKEAPAVLAKAEQWQQRLNELLKVKSAEILPPAERTPEMVKIGRKTTLRLRERVTADEGTRLFEQAREYLAQEPPDPVQAREALERMRLGLGPDFPGLAREILANLVRRDAKREWRTMEQRMAEKKGERVTAEDVELMSKAVADMGLATTLGCNETREQLPIARQLFTQIRLAAENGWLIEWDAKMLLGEADPPPDDTPKAPPPRRVPVWMIVAGIAFILVWAILGLILWQMIKR